MNILVSPLSQTPIYKQIQEQIKELILTGRLKPEVQLPSIRQLARDLKVGIITVKRAYEELEREGLILNIQGRGAFVALIDTGRVKEIHLAMLAERMQELKDFAQTIGISKDEMFQVLTSVYRGDEE